MAKDDGHDPHAKPGGLEWPTSDVIVSGMGQEQARLFLTSTVGQSSTTLIPQIRTSDLNQDMDLKVQTCCQPTDKYWRRVAAAANRWFFAATAIKNASKMTLHFF